MSGLPLTSPSPTNNQPALWVLSFLYTIYAISVLAVRYGVRRKFRRSDQVLLGGHIIGLVNWALLWTGLSKGLAKATSIIAPDKYATVSQLVLGGVVTLLLAQTCAIVSQCLFISEYLPSKAQKMSCYVAAGVTGALSIGAILSTVAGCEGMSYLNTGSSGCSNQSARWTIAAVLLSLASCVPGALSFNHFHQLQTKVSTKIKLYMAFSSAMLNIPLLGGIASTASTYFAHGRDSLDAMPWLVCLQTLLLLSYVSASMPCAPPLALKFTTAGLVFIDEATSNMSTRNKSRNISGSRLASNITKSVDGIEPVRSHFNDITGGAAVDEANSVASFGSERQIIRKTVGIDVSVSVVDG